MGVKGLKAGLFLILVLCGCTVPRDRTVPSSLNQERPESTTDVKPSFVGWGDSESEVESRRKIQSLESQHDALATVVRIARKRFRTQQYGSLSNTDWKELSIAIDSLEKNSSDRVEFLFYFARLCRSDYEAGMAPGTLTDPYIEVFDAAFWEVCERLSHIPGKDASVALSELEKGLDRSSRKRIEELRLRQQYFKQ